MIKQIKFVSIPVADQNRALDFYTEKLGFTIITDQPFDGKQRWIELREVSEAPQESATSGRVSALHCHVRIWRRRGFSECRFERDRFVTFNFRGGDPGDDTAA